MTKLSDLNRSESDLTEEVISTSAVIDSTRGCKIVSGPTRRSRRWTPEQDKLLTNAVYMYKGKNWKKIAECVPGKEDNITNNQCLHRWGKVLNPNLNKGPWRKEEDELLTKLVQTSQDPKRPKWSNLSKQLFGRIGKQCRERWLNHLDPTIKKTSWTKEEELILVQAQKRHGNKWAKIAKILHGRTENSIKNQWNCSLKKRLDQFQNSPISVMVSGSGSSSSASSFFANETNTLPFQIEDATESPQKDSLYLTTINEISHSTPSTNDHHHMSLWFTTLSPGTPKSNNNSNENVYVHHEMKEIRERLRMAASTFKNTPSIISRRSSPAYSGFKKQRTQEDNGQTLVKCNTSYGSKPLERRLEFDFL